jgi:hypothetical protein
MLSGGYQNFAQELKNIGIKITDAQIYRKSETSKELSIQLQLKPSKAFIESITVALHSENSDPLEVEKTQSDEAVVQPQNKAYLID